jgi:type II secretory pathway pseudopilin PulG
MKAKGIIVTALTAAAVSGAGYAIDQWTKETKKAAQLRVTTEANKTSLKKINEQTGGGWAIDLENMDPERAKTYTGSIKRVTTAGDETISEKVYFESSQQYSGGSAYYATGKTNRPEITVRTDESGKPVSKDAGSLSPLDLDTIQKLYGLQAPVVDSESATHGHASGKFNENVSAVLGGNKSVRTFFYNDGGLRGTTFTIQHENNKPGVVYSYKPRWHEWTIRSEDKDLINNYPVPKEVGTFKDLASRTFGEHSRAVEKLVEKPRVAEQQPGVITQAIYGAFRM